MSPSAWPSRAFISYRNDELLEILAQTRNVQAIQPRMMKSFDAIKKLDFGGDHSLSPAPKDENSTDIYRMVSSEGEYVSLGANLKARNEVENWLWEIEKAMVKGMQQLCREALDDFDRRIRHEWIFGMLLSC